MPTKLLLTVSALLLGLAGLTALFVPEVLLGATAAVPAAGRSRQPAVTA